MIIVFIVLAASTGLTFFVGAIQGLVAWHSTDPLLQRRLRPFIIGCVILTLAFACASYISLSSIPNTTATPSPKVGPSSPTSSSTATSISQVTPDVTPTALASDGTITVNKLLTCNTCSGGNDPIHFTVKSITVDNGRTDWTATLNNISGNTYDVTNPGITLQISSGATQSVQSTGYISTYMNSGDKAIIHFTFAFVPFEGVPYTFLAHLSTSDATINMPFDPMIFTFPTATSIAQVTSDVTPTALAADSTIKVNKLLTCGTCSGGNDPIHFTVNSITVDNADGRTDWTATLNNISGNTYDVTNPGITLQISSGATQSVRSTGYISTYMNSGDKAIIHFTFSFVPLKGGQYTFSAHLSTSDATINMPFDPMNFTF